MGLVYRGLEGVPLGEVGHCAGLQGAGWSILTLLNGMAQPRRRACPEVFFFWSLRLPGAILTRY